MDYATPLWEELVKSIGNTNMMNGILCARYWSLILQYVYEKEGIVVLDDVPKAEFSLYHHPKVVEDNPNEFPLIARITDALF